MVTAVTIDGRRIGPRELCFIIAEAGVNHNGRVETARRLVDVAVQAGADAVKFQTFKAERVISSSAPKARYQRETTGAAQSQLEMARQLELPFEAFRQLDADARARGILFLSTPFDEESADFLAMLGVPAFKMPSGEITNLPFLERVARFGKPMIVSTGMSTLQEVETAVRVIRAAGNREIVLLHCVSSYPAQPSDVNLRAMQTMSEAFGLPVGYSDHTLGLDVALAAVALGACVIEKHFTLDRTLPGPDHPASLEPDELRTLIEGIRRVERALGNGVKYPSVGELEMRAVARRSVVTAHALRAGHVLRPEDLAAKRAATIGLAPAQLTELVGRKLIHAVNEDAVLHMEDLEPS